MRIVVIYDDTGRKSEAITDIIGDKGFSDVVVRKRHLEDYYRETVEKVYPGLIWKKIHSPFEYAEILKEMDVYDAPGTRVMHCFSNYLITDVEKAGLSFQKLELIDSEYGVMNGNRAVAAMFSSVAEWKDFCRSVVAGMKPWDIIRSMPDFFEIEGVADIGVIDNFIQCITGNFESRFFNSVQGNEYTLVKSSSNKKKIKAEYEFWHLLPDDMKYWFVMPFDYEESEESASYRMEHLHMADLSIKWVHGSMDETEFNDLMDKYFYFFGSRHEKSCSKEEYQKISDDLYVEKVWERKGKLESLQEYSHISTMLSACGISLDLLIKKYFSLKDKIESSFHQKPRLVIGHGDPCFANALYNKSTRTLKFIDPKGALSEKELWTHPYYDVAKLSHSVCGRYDFFNNAMYDIHIGEDFSFDLDIPFDNRKYIEIFRKKAEENGFNYLLIRIYEVSLFLSMLPLHMDNPHKVLGFILNADNIMKEIETYV